MSQFDFPRINFAGGAFVSPPTANNNSFFPLVLFDPVNVKAVMPPRIYVSMKLLSMHASGLLKLPDISPILRDSDDSMYFQIATVNTNEIFKQWATTPLGESPFDKPFHSLYYLIKTAKENQLLAGLIPSNWNYFGGMEFGFFDVKITTVALQGKDKTSKCFSRLNKDSPPDIREILDAPVNFVNERGKAAAVMVDVIPSLPFYSQIFADSFQVPIEGSKFISGKPGKASLRFLNANRIVNQEGPMAASGTFFCVIPIVDLEEGFDSPVMKLFAKYKASDRAVAGVFIRFNLFEVKETWNVTYDSANPSSNPATCSVSGSISPWYADELKSITMGRLMIPVESFLQDKTIGSFVLQVNTDRKTIGLDLVGSIPETFSASGYQTIELNRLAIRYKLSTGQEMLLGTIVVNEEHLSRNEVVSRSGVFEISLAEHIVQDDPGFERGHFLLYGSLNAEGNEDGERLLMRESEFMVASDQAGLYLNQHDNPADGYFSYGHEKEPCKITVYRRGRPFEGIMHMKIRELSVSVSSAVPSIRTFMDTNSFENNAELLFPSREPANLMYILYPGTSEEVMNYTSYVMHTGFVISLRVLPKHNYDRYIDPTHIDYPTSIPFELVYKEVLQVYDLLYPSSSIITPFKEEYFVRGWKFIRQRLAPENWNSGTYMPSSRDMSYDQWRLLCRWQEAIRQAGNGPD